MSQNLKKKIFHICMIILIIISIFFVVGMFILEYQVKGETNLPFELSKISIISTVDAESVEGALERWNLNVNQNNDIYIYIEKNDNYRKTETIKEVSVDNFIILEKPLKGNLSIYKPSKEDVSIFKNKEYNIADKIIFNGDLSSNIQDLKVSNQGGVVAFRCANSNLGQYISNDGEEINYNELLKKINIDNESLYAKISFDITISLDSGKSFKSTIETDILAGNVVDDGRVAKEITNLDNIIFKRIEN